MPGRWNLPGEIAEVLRQSTGFSRAPGAPAPFHCMLGLWAREQRGLTTDPICLGCFSQISPGVWRSQRPQQAFSIPLARSATRLRGKYFSTAL